MHVSSPTLNMLVLDMLVYPNQHGHAQWSDD